MDKPGPEGFCIDDWRVSPAEGLLDRGGDAVHLEPKAMEVLVYFASRPGEVITREALEQDVWHGALVGYDAVTNTIIKLRKALQDNARQPRFIATIPKKGYQLIASVTCPGEGKVPGSEHPVVSKPVAGTRRLRSSWPTRKAGMVMLALAGMLISGLAWVWSSALPLTESATSADSQHRVGQPTIIVLPFQNLSDDPEQEYLSDGITEDIITDLSRLSSIMVIASNTSFAYKGRQVTTKQVGRDLDVAFVLKGSIRQLGNVIRVNVQLVNAATGFNLWAQRYDRDVAELFKVQDEVTHSIVESLAVKITSQEKYSLAQRATANLKAYDLFQEGQRIFRTGTREANEQAREMFLKAIEFDPDYGRAYGAIAIILARDFRWSYIDEPIEDLDRALEFAKKAVALDNSSPQNYWALGYVYLMRKDYTNAQEAAAQSINIAPGYADGYGLLAMIRLNSGQPEKAVELSTRAMRLNPYYTWEYLYNLGAAYYMLGNYNAAISSLENAQERNENIVTIKLYLAASYVKSGRQDDAEWIADELQVLNPTATLGGIEKTIPLASPELMRPLLEDLRIAGLPE